ncbi:TetR/AcrR family transcriptional regulator [Acetobacterium bakii]|uniref:TetR/AcrR family transcriptional regulator n=1 Tax=Acetobacterium bakii TaxID=52689 RepID=UPI000681B7BC|nr:TetR/AcrR family transcriptional regulator [Acetobacterium bakii]
MPKQTFLNLTTAKQDQIIKAGISVFSQSTFNEVKISSIISEAKIPRSSFYDYFDDKKDIYKYIILLIKDEKMTYMDPILNRNNLGFFEKLRDLFKAGAGFAAAKPEYNSIARRMYENMPLLEELFGAGSIDVSESYKFMLEEGINAGEIKKDVDVAFISKTIHILSSQMMIDAMKNKEDAMNQVIDDITDKIIDFIRSGISNK